MKNSTNVLILLFLFVILVFTVKQHSKKEKQEIFEEVEQISVEVDYTNYYLAIEEIKRGESLQLEPYFLDKNWYIGYGYQTKHPSTNITEEQADSLLDLAYKQKLRYVNKTYHVFGNEALALAMLYYATKPISIRKSILHRELLSENPDSSSIYVSWVSFCNFQGKEHPKIKKRREFEVNLFFTK